MEYTDFICKYYVNKSFAIDPRNLFRCQGCVGACNDIVKLAVIGNTGNRNHRLRLTVQITECHSRRRKSGIAAKHTNAVQSAQVVFACVIGVNLCIGNI